VTALRPLRSWCAAWALVTITSIAAAADPIPAKTIERARDAVLSRPEFIYEAPAKNNSFWRRALTGFFDFIQEMQEDYPLAFWGMFILLALLLLVLIAHIVWTIRVAGRGRYDSGRLALEDAVRRADPGPFRTRAMELAAGGDLEGAVRALYTALLLTMDRAGTVRFARHKALLDYRIETASDDAARATLDFFASTYHPGSFGRCPPTREQFELMVARLDEVRV
jgi:cbb3-type cytochrome oxidase subunit 3